MKTIGSLSLATALLVGTMAMAQTPPPDDSGSGNSNSDITQNNAPANNTPSKATDASDAPPQSVAQACHKQASDKQLTGDAKTSFMKDCKQGKTTRSGN
jgi:hypothetical protein